MVGNYVEEIYGEVKDAGEFLGEPSLNGVRIPKSLLLELREWREEKPELYEEKLKELGRKEEKFLKRADWMEIRKEVIRERKDFWLKVINKRTFWSRLPGLDTMKKWSEEKALDFFLLLEKYENPIKRYRRFYRLGSPELEALKSLDEEEARKKAVEASIEVNLFGRVIGERKRSPGWKGFFFPPFPTFGDLSKLLKEEKLGKEEKDVIQKMEDQLLSFRPFDRQDFFQTARDYFTFGDLREAYRELARDLYPGMFNKVGRDEFDSWLDKKIEQEIEDYADIFSRFEKTLIPESEWLTKYKRAISMTDAKVRKSIKKGEWIWKKKS